MIYQRHRARHDNDSSAANHYVMKYYVPRDKHHTAAELMRRWDGAMIFASGEKHGKEQHYRLAR